MHIIRLASRDDADCLSRAILSNRSTSEVVER